MILITLKILSDALLWVQFFKSPGLRASTIKKYKMNIAKLYEQGASLEQIPTWEPAPCAKYLDLKLKIDAVLSLPANPEYHMSLRSYGSVTYGRIRQGHVVEW